MQALWPPTSKEPNYLNTQQGNDQCDGNPLCGTHDCDPLGIRHLFRCPGQHPVRRHTHSADSDDVSRRNRRMAALVGCLHRCMLRRKRHHHRSVRKRCAHRHFEQERLSDHLHGLSEDRIAFDAASYASLSSNLNIAVLNFTNFTVYGQSLTIGSRTVDLNQVLIFTVNLDAALFRTSGQQIVRDITVEGTLELYFSRTD